LDTNRLLLLLFGDAFCTFGFFTGFTFFVLALELRRVVLGSSSDSDDNSDNFFFDLLARFAGGGLIALLVLALERVLVAGTSET